MAASFACGLASFSKSLYMYMYTRSCTSGDEITRLHSFKFLHQLPDISVYFFWTHMTLTSLKSLCRYVLESEHIKKFFNYIQLPNFDVAADATATFKVKFSPFFFHSVDACGVVTDRIRVLVLGFYIGYEIMWLFLKILLEKQSNMMIQLVWWLIGFVMLVKDIEEVICISGIIIISVCWVWSCVHASMLKMLVSYQVMASCSCLPIVIVLQSWWLYFQIYCRSFWPGISPQLPDFFLKIMIG